jgi:hypothetical protein
MLYYFKTACLIGLFTSMISLDAADYFGGIDTKNVLFSIYESSYTIQENMEIGQLIFVDKNKKMRLVGTLNKQSFVVHPCESITHKEYKCLDNISIEGRIAQGGLVGTWKDSAESTSFSLKPVPWTEGTLTCEMMHQFPKVVFHASLNLGTGFGSPLTVDYECNGTIKNLPFMQKILKLNKNIRRDWELGTSGGSIRYALARQKYLSFLSAGIAPDVFENEQKNFRYYYNITRDEHIQAIQRYFKLWAHQSLGNFETYIQFWDEYVRVLSQLTKHYQSTFHLSKEKSEAYAKTAMQYIFLDTAGSTDGGNQDISHLDKRIITSQNITKELLKSFKNVPQEQLDQGLKTAILHQKNIGYLEALLDTGAHIDVSHESALFFALRQPNVVIFLLSKGANVNYENSFGKTALFYAIAYNDYNLAELLINHNADVNHRYFSREKLDQIDYSIGAGYIRIDRPLRTPLMHAAQNSDVKMMKLLIEHGADINAQDENGATIADYAKGSKKKENLDFAYSLGLKENPNVSYFE